MGKSKNNNEFTLPWHVSSNAENPIPPAEGKANRDRFLRYRERFYPRGGCIPSEER